jgi:hypothetical protein
MIWCGRMSLICPFLKNSDRFATDRAPGIFGKFWSLCGNVRPANSCLFYVLATTGDFQLAITA